MKSWDLNRQLHKCMFMSCFDCQSSCQDVENKTIFQVCEKSVVNSKSTRVNRQNQMPSESFGAL